MKGSSFGFLVISATLVASLGACSSSDSSGSGGKSGSGGTGGGTGGSGTGGSGTGGSGTGGSGTGGGNTGGSAGQGTGGGNTGGSAGMGTGGGNTGGSAGMGTGGGNTGGTGGAPSCAVASSACTTCRTTHCDAQDKACSSDTACNAAGKTAGGCICTAQMSSGSTGPCLQTFSATDATAKAIADCMTTNCATPCGL